MPVALLAMVRAVIVGGPTVASALLFGSMIAGTRATMTRVAMRSPQRRLRDGRAGTRVVVGNDRRELIARTDRGTDLGRIGLPPVALARSAKRREALLGDPRVAATFGDR